MSNHQILEAHNETAKYENTEEVIPKGLYCYDEKGRCPYWFKIEGQDHQASGYCTFLKSGDFMEDGTILLWDQVKECGVKMDEENDLT